MDLIFISKEIVKLLKIINDLVDHIDRASEEKSDLKIVLELSQYNIIEIKNNILNLSGQREKDEVLKTEVKDQIDVYREKEEKTPNEDCQNEVKSDNEIEENKGTVMMNFLRSEDNDAKKKKTAKVIKKETYCNVCMQDFKKPSQLERHIMRIHTEPYLHTPNDSKDVTKASHTCNDCGRVFGLKKSLEEHIVKAHGIGFGGRSRNKCIICRTAFESVTAFIDHFNKDHTRDDGFFICNYANNYECKYNTEIRLDFIKHVIVQHQFLPFYECDICSHPNVFFTNVADIRMHMNENHQAGNNTKQCPMCNIEMKELKRKRDVYHHYGQHSALQFQCQVCDRPFGYGKLLEQHMINHFSEKMKPCQICGKEVHKAKYDEHVEIHSISEAKIPCPQCDKLFLTDQRVKQHVSNVHKNVENHMCSFCPKIFRFKKSLKEHLETHNGNRERKFPCQQCSQVCFDKHHLKRHVKVVHTKDYHFHCKFCGKGFSGNNPLRRHEMIHTGERPYCCKICNKGFIQEVNYKTHMKSAHALQP